MTVATRTLIVRGRRAIGPGLPAYVIAEIGTNHNRRLDTAKEMLRALARTGCDCAKFQIYEPDEIVSARVRASEYGFDGIYGDISAKDMFERFLKTPKTWFPELRDLCHALGMDFSATIHGEDGLHWARQTGLDVVKVASMDHNNVPFLRSLVNAVDAPLLVSTGMAGLSDVDALVGATEAHAPGIGLFHCCSIYPAPVDVARLPNIPFLAHRYPWPAGFSDHTLGNDAALVARRTGAMMFEKHVTLDKTQPGPDHSFAMEMDEFRDYVAAIRAAPAGAVEPAAAFLEPGDAEWANRRLALKSLITRRPLSSGHTLAASDLYLARPGTGIPPSSFDAVVGRRLTRAVAAESPLQWEDVAGND